MTYLENRNRHTDLENKSMVTRANVVEGEWQIRSLGTDNQQEPTVQHRELYSGLCKNMSGKRIWKRIHIYV